MKPPSFSEEPSGKPNGKGLPVESGARGVGGISDSPDEDESAFFYLGIYLNIFRYGNLGGKIFRYGNHQRDFF